MKINKEGAIFIAVAPQMQKFVIHLFCQVAPTIKMLIEYDGILGMQLLGAMIDNARLSNNFLLIQRVKDI